MKDCLNAYGADSRGGRGAFADVSPARRCPICESGSWCQVAHDGLTVLCKRVGDGTSLRTNRAGVDYYVHHLGARPFRAAPYTPRPSHQRASVETLDVAYRAALAALRLDDADRESLRHRGLDARSIAANGYATLPERGRAQIARAVVDAVGERDATGVPGIVWKPGDRSRGWWSFSGWSGLLVPVRDGAGRIVALKVRRRDPCNGQRYFYVSSTASGGPSAASTMHFPLSSLAMRDRPLVITEGELKADVSTHLADRPVVSLPGVGAWRLALDAVAAWGAGDVVVAFDADARTNPNVARALLCLVDALRAAGTRVATWKWDECRKGLDDHLYAVRRDEPEHAR